MASPRTSISRRKPGRRRVAQAVGLSLVIGVLGISAGSAGENVDVPDVESLPTYPQSGRWIQLRATGLNYAESAKQWIQLPSMVTAAFNRSSTNLTDNQCISGAGLYPYRTRTARHATVHFRSTPGSSQPYGNVGFTVRTVAFGSIPVEAKIQLQQPRDENNKSIGLDFRSLEGFFCSATSPFGNYPTFHVRNVRLEGELNVAVVNLKVDGVDLKLRGKCRTTEPSAIKLTAPDYYQVSRSIRDFEYFTETGPGATPLPPDQTPESVNMLTTPLFQPVSGGLFTGNVSIGPFSGCTTASGEDVSQLLTTTVSGDTNAARTRSEGIESNFPVVPQGAPFPQMPIPTSAP